MLMNLIHEDKTRLLHGMLFELHNEVGWGRREEAYVLYPDLVVWDRITVELKAVPFQ
jgi:hypothetical protein